MTDLLVMLDGRASPDRGEHLIVRRSDDGFYRLFGILHDEPDEFEVTGETYGSEARAVDAAQSFALSMQVERIYVVRGE